MTCDWKMLKDAIRPDAKAMRVGMRYERLTGVRVTVRSDDDLWDLGRRAARKRYFGWLRVERALEVELGLVDLGEAGA